MLSNYSVYVMETAPRPQINWARELKIALKDVGANAKTCAIAVSTSDSLIRIIEQPETPREILRDAIRLNGLSLLNQDVKEFVLDCEKITGSASVTPAATGAPNQPQKYLVAGLARSRVQLIDQAFLQYRKASIHNIQLASVCTFNAFEFSIPRRLRTRHSCWWILVITIPL